MLKLTEGCIWGEQNQIFFGVLQGREESYNTEVRDAVGREEYFSLLFILSSPFAHFLPKHSLS